MRGRCAVSASGLTTTEMYHLNEACKPILRAFGDVPYLVGSTESGAHIRPRDVDVRLIVGDDEFAAVCPTLERWELLCLAIGAYLKDRTGLPIDFQIQRRTEANEKHKGQRNPLGTERRFAGGGDATEWSGMK